jgi:GTP cyclohydrolase I
MFLKELLKLKQRSQRVERSLQVTISKVTVTDGRASGPYDQARAEKAVRELLLALGEDPDREGLKETPARVARAMKENFEGLWQSPEDVLTTTFDIGHEELVIVRDIEVFSHCEHHLTPFHGVAHVGYIPSGKITGLSKIARLVDMYSRRPQVQERLTTQIADAMVEILNPLGVIVIIDCEHLCMSMRGVKKSNARTTTSAVRGVLQNTATRAEAISLITNR